jgi:hypothetical protein
MTVAGARPERDTAPSEVDWLPVATIEPSSDGTFQHAEVGILAKLYQIERGGELIDVVAWPFSDPTIWWLRWRAVDLLGEPYLARAAAAARPVRVFETPQSWLHEGVGEGICILDWRADLRAILDPFTLVPATPRLARALRRALAAAPIAGPRILEPRRSGGRAA